LAGCAAAALVGCGGPQDPEFVTSVPWSYADRFLIVDTHTHSTFSDGRLSPTELFGLAKENGCDAVAITDHSDAGAVATAAYFDAIDTARRQVPGLIVFAGLEWNVPPYGGREHVIVVTAPRLERELTRFRAAFEGEQNDAVRGFAWLEQLRADPHEVIALYAHPSRKDASVGENRSDVLEWRRGGERLIGFEGAPGHQRAERVGSYKGPLKTVSGWDPVAAEVGGAWDQLLDEGLDIWAALAPSDFHNQKLDYPPCGFSRTHVQVAERSHAGILAALHAGTFWADHGKVLDALTVHAGAPGLLVPASPGESFSLGDAGAVTVTVSIEPGFGASGRTMIVDFIGNGRNGQPQLLESQRFETAAVVEARFADLVAGSDGSSAYFRVRVRVEGEDGRKLAAYSNPIRVYLDAPRR
jgi:hypothetical protein